MSLNLGTLHAKITVDDSGVASKLSNVKRDLRDVKVEADKVAKANVDVTPKGTDKLSKAGSEAKKLGTELQGASKAGQGLKVSTQPAQELANAESKASGLRNALSGMGSVGQLVGVGAAAGGVAAAFGQAMQLGNAYTNELNTMNAVSGASASQLAAVSQRARELGNDTSLANTSASDAAAAMTELAKGGFSVEQSMDAAKGTLQLAAAAGIDAASAATIQSQALQSFGLDASYAAKSSDVLANAANQSSAEITGIAQGLQQSGAVANQFGLSLEDTSATLGMLANAGIQGSDAGTLLKSTLLALTDQGAPAQAAIEELGLQVYDANGKFVGMSSLMGQLEKASKSMSDEQYQAATATLFGSDAMRLAGVAAEQGQAGFDRMREAMDKQGAAADVAAAKTHGLPGAIAAVQNAGEEAALSLYDKFSGPLESALEGVASGITGIGGAIQAVPFPVFAALAGAAALKLTGVTGKAQAFGNALRETKLAAEASGRSISTMAGTVQVLGQKYATIGRATSAFQNSSTPLRIMGIESREAATQLTGMSRVMTAAKGNAQTFGGVLKGSVSGGFSLAKSGAEGLMGALGGPWGLAITAATTAIGFLVQKHSEAKAAEEEHKAAQDELKASLDETTGSITEQTNQLIQKKLEESGAADGARELGIAQSTVKDAIDGNAHAMAEVRTATQDAVKSTLEGSKAWQSLSDDFSNAGISADDVTKAMLGSKDAMEKITSNPAMRDRGMAASWEGLKNELNDTAGSAIALGTEVGNLNGDLNQVKTEATQEQLNQLKKTAEDTKGVFDLIGDAMYTMPNATTISISADANVTNDTLDKINEIGDGIEAVRNIDGSVTISLPEGQTVFETLQSIGAELGQIEQNGKQYIEIGNNAPEVQSLLTALGIQTETLPSGEVVIASNTDDQINKLVDLGVLVRDEKTGSVVINSNLDEVLNKAGQLDERDGKLTQEKHTVSYEERRITYWENQGYSASQAAEIQGPVPVNQLGGRINALAEGGMPSHGGYRLPETGPGTEKTDGFLGLGSDGVPTAWVNKNEWVINDRSSDKYNSLLAAINADNPNAIRAEYMRMLPYYATGGVVGSRAVVAADEIKSILSPMVGTPYVFGGWSEAGTDCSGAVSLTVNVSEGLDQWDSRTSTATEGQWLLDKGYSEGQGSSGDIRVGLYNGGEGGGHTAIQLENGTYIESGGNTGGGFTIGGKAGPLEGRGFTDWYHKQGAESTSSSADEDSTSLTASISGSTSKKKNQRILNGGAGTLIKDGSVLELAAALNSRATGYQYGDDIVSWGQVTGLHSIDEEDTDTDKLSSSIDDLKEKLDTAKTDLTDAEEDLRIKRMKRDETNAKTNKDGTPSASESEKAQADQTVAKAERKVEDLKKKIADLEKEISDNQSKLDKANGNGGTSGNKYADAIIKEGRRRGITDTGIKIALATALVESNMQMYANTADPASLDLPHDAVGSDLDSVGLFQQRANGAWGTTADRMDPARSAGMFYDKLDDADYNQGDPGAHAQRVQASAYPGRYDERMGEAQSLLDAYNRGKFKAFAKGGFAGSPGILGTTRQSHINEGTAMLMAEAGPEALISLAPENKARSLDIWAETGKRLGVDVLSMVNLLASGLPGLMEGKLEFSTGSTISAERMGVNMDAASYRGQSAVNNAVGAVFNGPVQINDPRQYLQAQLGNAEQALSNALRNFNIR